MPKKNLTAFYTVLILLIGQSLILVTLLLVDLGGGIQSWWRGDNEVAALKQEIEKLKTEFRQSAMRSYVNSHQLPLPVVFCGDTLDTDDPVTRERLEREFFTLLNEQGQIQLYLKRWARYLPMIEKYLREANLPDDLKYVAVHESALLPYIRSRSNAVGLWQFMRATGRLYNLKINEYIDERRESEKATAAAMIMFRDLKNILGDWPLVLASYNGGLGRVVREIEKQRTHSFFELSLPEETERYYFKTVATKIVLSQPEKFGFNMEGEDFHYKDKIENISVTIESDRIPLDDLARSFRLNPAQLKIYNPQLINSYLPRGIFNIRIPLENYLLYKRSQEKVEEISSTYSGVDENQVNLD